MSIIIYYAAKEKIEDYQINLKFLDQEKGVLIQKIYEAKQKKIRREKTMAEFLKAQQSGLFSVNDPDSLIQMLEQVCYRSGLQNLNYQIKQVEKKQFKNVTLHWHKIIFELEHYQDRAIYEFIETLSTKISGLIIPEQLSLTRGDSSLSEKELNKEVSGFYYIYLITFDRSALTTP